MMPWSWCFLGPSVISRVRTGAKSHRRRMPVSRNMSSRWTTERQVSHHSETVTSHSLLALRERAILPMRCNASLGRTCIWELEAWLTRLLRPTPGRQAYRKMMFSKSNGYSMMPVVGTRTRSTSCCVGTNDGMAIRSMSVR